MDAPDLFVGAAWIEGAIKARKARQVRKFMLNMKEE